MLENYLKYNSISKKGSDSPTKIEKDNVELFFASRKYVRFFPQIEIKKKSPSFFNSIEKKNVEITFR